MPWTLSVGAGLVLAQGVVVTLTSMVYLVLVTVGDAEARAAGEAAGILGLLTGLLLAGLGVLLLRRRRGARGPAVACELFALPVAYYVLQAGAWLVAAPVAVSSLVVLVLLNTRPSLVALGVLTPGGGAGAGDRPD